MKTEIGKTTGKETAVNKKTTCFQSAVLAAAMLLCTSCQSDTSANQQEETAKPTTDQLITVDFSHRSGAPLV